MFDVHFVFGIFGNITALILFLVPLITFWKIVKKKSTEQFSGMPYVSTLLNCLLSAWYGLPFVSPNNILVSTVNGTGAVIELCYVLVFLFYARNNKYRVKIFGLFAIVLTVFAVIAAVSILALHGNRRKLLCGFAAAIFSVCMYASPLSIMRTVIRTKSVKYMPFFLSLFVFLCGTSWFVFGLLGGDPFVSVPNGVGSVLGAMQLILYTIYKDWKSLSNTSTSAAPLEEKIVVEKEKAMEMGLGYPQTNDINESHQDQNENRKKMDGFECRS